MIARRDPGIRWRTDDDHRYLAEIEASAALLEACARGDAGAMATAIDARLAALRDALVRAPFWIARLRDACVSVAAIEALEDLRALPPLDRSALAARSADLVAWPDADALVRVTSSGSTGAPVDVYRDGLDQRYMWACVRFWLRMARVELGPRPRAAMICTLPGGLAYSRRAPLFLGGALHRVSVKDGDDEACRRLARVRPSVLFGDPEALAWLTRRPPLPSVRLVLSSAQTLSPALRAEVTAHLGAPVVDYYACTETGPIAWACLTDGARFHVLAPDVFVDVEDGALLVTRLRPGPFPLVRYAPGDRGAIVDERCACGFVGRSIVDLEARGHVRFVRPDGVAVDPWRLAFLFKRYPVRAFRLAQIEASRFALSIVGELDPELVARVEDALRQLGWPAPRVAATSVDAIVNGAKASPFVAISSSTE